MSTTIQGKSATGATTEMRASTTGAIVSNSITPPKDSIYAQDMNELFAHRHAQALPHPVVTALDRVRAGSFTVETIAKILLCSVVAEDNGEPGELPRQVSANLLAGLQLLGGYMGQDLDRLDSWLDKHGPKAAALTPTNHRESTEPA